MQKLLRRSPPAAGPILLSATPPANFPFSLKLSPKLQTKFISVTSSCTITTGDNFSSYFSSSTKGSSLFVEPHAVQRMPTAAAALKLRPCVGVDVNSLFSSKPTFSARLSSGGTCRVCRCSIDNGVNPHRRWVAFKGVRNGSRLAWVHTTANGDGSVSAVEGFNGTDKDDADVEQQGESNTEEKPVKLQRRQRGSRGGVLGLPANPDLLTIPGVGPRNLRKLVDKGIAGVDQLKQLYRDKFLGQSNEKMVEYLRSSVGIVHINHAESITTYIKESVDEDLKDGSDSGVKPQKKRLTFCVEGNISVGKTTFLQRIANETLELQDLVEIVPEPIDKWQNVGPDHFNILDAFYAEPQRYAYTFQNYVFVTRLMQERESSAGMKPLRLMERSVFSDRMVFVRAVHEAKWMNEMEISIYDSWFDPVVSSLPGLIPDGFIYLRASPDTCHKRMMLRRRAEEGGVSLDYLRDLHEKHESWLLPFQSGNHGVFSVSEVPFSMDSSLHPDIRDRVLYLEGSHMHSSIQKVPALVLDCEPDIDFNKDIDAKQHYARQVAEFFEFVKRKKDDAPLKAGEKAGKSGQQQVVLPSQGGLWAPGGKRFSELELNSLNLDRVMSFLSR